MTCRASMLPATACPTSAMTIIIKKESASVERISGPGRDLYTRASGGPPTATADTITPDTNPPTNLVLFCTAKSGARKLTTTAISKRTPKIVRRVLVGTNTRSPTPPSVPSKLPGMSQINPLVSMSLHSRMAVREIRSRASRCTVAGSTSG